MIRTETITIEGKQFTKTWSDENRYVVRDGFSYGEAIDPSELGRIYTEGDYIDEPDDEDAEMLLKIITGEIE